MMLQYRAGARLLLPILLIGSAAGCASTAAPQAGRTADEHAPLPARKQLTPRIHPVRALSDIAGEWDIVSFDGHSPPRLDPYGQRHAYVDIGQGRLDFSISCNFSGMAGAIRGGVLHAARGDMGVQTVMGCGPEREARERAFFRFFRSRPRVSRLSGARLRMTGSGHELVLERAAVRRLAAGPTPSEIAGAWRVISLYQFENGGRQGWGAMNTPGRVRIENGALSYSRCPAATVRFTYTADFVLRRAEAGPPAGSATCGDIDPAPTEAERKLAALLGQSPEAERVTGGRLVLRSRDYAVLLTREAEYQREFGEEAAEWERRPG